MPTKVLDCQDIREEFPDKNFGECCCKCGQSCIKNGKLPNGWGYKVCCVVSNELNPSRRCYNHILREYK